MPIYAAQRLLLNTKHLRSLQRLHRSRGSKLGALLGTARCPRALSTTVNATRGESLNAAQDDIRSIYEAYLPLEGVEAAGIPDVVTAASRLSERPRDILRISVHSSNGAGHDLVSAILDDPLSSDTSLRSKILDRWKSMKEVEPNTLLLQQSNVPSPFFTRFQDHGVTVEIIEVGRGIDHRKTFVHTACSEIPIIVMSIEDIDSTRYTIPSLDPCEVIIMHNPNSLLILDGPFHPDSPALEGLKRDVAESFGVDVQRIIACDSKLAVRGGSILAKDASSASAVSSFQKDISASNITHILERISRVVALGPDALRVRAMQALAETTVFHGGQVVEERKGNLNDLRNEADDILTSVLEEREKTVASILGSDPDVTSSEERSQVELGMDRVKKELEPLLNGLSWTKLPFVVDDVSTRIDGAVERALTRQFGNELMFQTGRLAALQEKLEDSDDVSFPRYIYCYRTPVVENRIEQIVSSPSYRITSTSRLPSLTPSELVSTTPPPALLAPLQNRATQLSHATRALHASAQRVLLISFSGTAGSFASSAFLCAFDVLDVTSGIAAGALGSLLGLRWTMGSWAKARARWWGAFKRVGEGLERDLDMTLKTVLDKQVLAVPYAECEEMKKFADKVEPDVVKADKLMKQMEAKYGIEREKAYGNHRYINMP